MATVTVTPEPVELALPDQVPIECLATYTLVVGYHHALGREAWRRLVIERLEQVIREVREGRHDPREEHHQ
jgi:hypothetical protein